MDDGSVLCFAFDYDMLWFLIWNLRGIWSIDEEKATLFEWHVAALQIISFESNLKIYSNPKTFGRPKCDWEEERNGAIERESQIHFSSLISIYLFKIDFWSLWKDSRWNSNKFPLKIVWKIQLGRVSSTKRAFKQCIVLMQIVSLRLPPHWKKTQLRCFICVSIEM